MYDNTLIHELLQAAPANYYAAMYDRLTKTGHIVLGYYTVCGLWIGELNLGVVPEVGQGFTNCPACLGKAPPKQLSLFGDKP